MPKKIEPWEHRHYDLGPLHSLLIEACVPEKKTGKKSVTVLRDNLGLKAAWTIFLWIKKERVPPHHANEIVRQHEKYCKRRGIDPTVSLRDFDSYVYTKS